MKTEFELEVLEESSLYGRAFIIGEYPKHLPYLKIEVCDKEHEHNLCIKDKDLERFAVNILKALKSNKLKP